MQPEPVDPEQFRTVSQSSPAAGTVFACSLCGARFTHAEKACSACPLNRGCEVVRCPNCGFQFPRESQLVRLARRLFRRGRETSGA